MCSFRRLFMQIKVNGKEQSVNKTEVSVKDILEINNIERPEIVSVQLNREFIKKEEYEKTLLKENDEIDFLYFMGGGSFNSNREES